MIGFTNKLCSRFVGPFPVTAIVNANAYTLALPPQLQALHPTFNIERLKAYRNGLMEFPTRPQANSRPPPVAEADTNGEAEYEVERVLAQRKRGRAVEYLVAWKGYPAEENTWEPRGKLTRSAADALADFNAQQQDADALGLAAVDDAPADSGAGRAGPQSRAPTKNLATSGTASPKRTVTRRYEGPLCQGRRCRVACGPDNNCPDGNARCHCPPNGEGWSYPELCQHCQDNVYVRKDFDARATKPARAIPLEEENKTSED